LALYSSQWRTVSIKTAQMNHLAEDIHDFAGPRFTRLFELWQQEGDDGVRATGQAWLAGKSSGISYRKLSVDLG